MSEENNTTFRPLSFGDFLGQNELKENLSVFIEAAKTREDALDHVLLVGPPGLGKTTLAKIIANEMDTTFHSTSGPSISKIGDLVAILTTLEKNSVLFIDEIHRMNNVIEEILYPAMEDFYVDLIIGEGSSSKSVRLQLEKFTLIGATTRIGLLTNPLRDRFGIPLRLNFYSDEDLCLIVMRNAKKFEIDITKAGAMEVARRSRGTPRIAGRLLRRVRDFATIDQRTKIEPYDVDKALCSLDVDKIGLDQMDKKYIDTIKNSFMGGPVGIETIAAALSESKDSIEDIIEPYLMKIGFLKRTSKGRILTTSAIEYSSKTLFTV